MIPRATYRLQFHKEFGFEDARKIAGYLARLGVSHLYASPWLKARPGSTHGYDIVDHHELNPELGDEAAFRDMVAELKKNGVRYEGHLWPDSVHGFFNDATPERYNKITAPQAWARTIAWFNQYARTA